MKRMIFWAGVGVLVLGIVLFAYSYLTIQNIKDVTNPFTISAYFNMHPEAKLQWDLANLLEPLGLGMLVLGVIMSAYGALRK